MINRLTVIKSQRQLGLPSFSEMYFFRELLLVLTFRDIKIRYKQAAIGIMWVVVQPVITMIVMTVIFGKLAKMPSEGIPYPVFVMTGLLPWLYFSKALTQGSMSMVSMQGMLTKVYFPRIFAPLAEVLSGLIDLAIGMVILMLMLMWYGITPSAKLFALPLIVLLLVINAFAISLWLSALNIEYRDIQFLLPFASQIWMYLTPIVYPISMIPERWKWLYMLNPISGAIDAFRWILLENYATPSLTHMGISLGFTLLILVGGLIYFDHSQRTLPDRV